MSRGANDVERADEATASIATHYVLGELEIDGAARRLRTRAGDVIHLSNRPFHVLLYLIAHRDRLVTRSELLERFWDGRDVYDDALTRCMSSVRKALNVYGDAARYIETRWAEGYRFIGPCEPNVRPESGLLDEHVKTGRRTWTYVSPLDSRSIEALYRRAIAYQSDHGRRSQRYAREMFRRVLVLVPDHARAWAGIAESHVLLCLYADGTAQERRLAAEASEMALALDPNLAEAHAACGQAAVLREDYEAADAAFARAQMLDPSLFSAWFYHARSYSARGEHERAVVRYERAAQLRPEDYQALALAEQSYRKLGLLADSRRAAERSVAAGERVLAMRPDDVRALSLTSSVLPELNRFDEARGWTERACALEPDEPFVNINAASVYVELGEHERALDYLERMPPTAGNRHWIEHDPTLDPLHESPRFDALLMRMGG